MVVAWACSNIGIAEFGDKCCYVNETCATYVCEGLGANITVDSSAGAPKIFQCFVNATQAQMAELNAPNGVCNSTSGGKGCLLRGATENATSESNSTSNGTSTTGGGNSAALRRLDVLHESWLLGFFILVFMLRKAM
ncbi:hypothetical protein IAT40_001422 [Kwoniella sp. CBS 6097]